MKKILFVFVLIIICFSASFADEYKYSDDPRKFIAQIEKEYPNEDQRVQNLQIILFDIYHLVQSRPYGNFFLEVNDYFKKLILKTNKKQLLPYYYYFYSSIKFYNQQSDSSLYYLNKSLESAKEHDVYDIQVHSIISIGVMNMISADTMKKYISDFLKLGYEKTQLVDDYFAKAAGAWSMIEYHIGNSQNQDSILYYRKLALNYLQKIPDDRITLKNFGINMAEKFIFYYFSKIDNNNAKKIADEALENIRKAIISNNNLKLINFDEILNFELMIYYSISNKLDSAVNIGLKYYYDKSFHKDFDHLKWEYALQLSKYFEKLGDYKNAYKYFKEADILYDNFASKSESIQRIAKLRELENINFQEKLKAEKVQRNLTYLIVFIVLLSLSAIIYVILNRYKKIKLLNAKLDEANSTKNKLFRIISHDLNGPVNSVLILSEQIGLYQDRMSKEDVVKTSSSIHKSTVQLKSILTTLLEWSKLNLEGFNAKKNSIVSTQSINDVIDDLSFQITNKQIQINIIKNHNLIVEYDADSLRVVLRNLLSNAIKFTPKSAEINIEINHNSISIIDSGAGFPENILSKNFSEITSKAGTNNERGLGLGLQIVRDICEKYNTKIKFSNTEKGGCVVLEF